MADPAPSTGLQRMILWCAIFGRLLTDVPGAFRADIFAAEDGGGAGRPQPPRQRLAACLETFIAGAGYGERPSTESMDYLIGHAGRSLGDAERLALLQEWSAVRDLPPPPDPTFVATTFRQFVQHRALVRAVFQASNALEGRTTITQLELDTVRRVLVAPFELGATSTLAPHAVLRTAKDRVALWASGEDDKHRIPTGFRPLDTGLRGGVRRGESFYVMAPPKGAKTTVQMNVACAGAQAGHGVLYVSYEMAQAPMLQRFDRRIAIASRGELQEDPRRLLAAAQGYIVSGGGEIWLVTASPREKHAVDRVARHVERLRAEGEEIGLVVFDYLNIMGSGGEDGLEKRHELASISREMSAFAKQYDVAQWSACLVNKKAVNKPRIRKDDIAEAFEIAAVLDGGIAVCADEEMRQNKLRRLYAAVLREHEDEVDAGLYRADIERLYFREVREAYLEDAQHAAAQAA